MTAVYETLNAKGYEFVNTVHGYDDDEILRSLGGSSRKYDWTPILVERGPVNRRSKGRPADLPFAGTCFLLRRSAVDALQDILDANGELLPMETQDGVELYVFNPRFVLDAFDKVHGISESNPGTRYVRIHKYAFIESVIQGIDIFRMTFGPRQLYFSDRFVDRVKKAKLKGTDFIKLWSSE